MGYRIVYGKREKKIVPFKKIGLMVVGLTTVAMLILPNARALTARIMLPGDPEVTSAALQNMIDDLERGQRIGDAVATFCREIIAGGK